MTPIRRLPILLALTLAGPACDDTSTPSSAQDAGVDALLEVDGETLPAPDTTGATDAPKGETSITPPPGPARRLSAGPNYTCLLRSDGEVECWGGSAALRFPPAGPFVEISAGNYHACARRADGTAACWGTTWFDEDRGVDRLGDFTARTFAQVVAGPQAICCGLEAADSTITCRPDGAFVGPPDVAGDPIVWFDLGVTGNSACALNANGRARCWDAAAEYFGPDEYRTYTSEWLTTPPETFTSLSVGKLAPVWGACGVTVDGAILCWGKGEGAWPAQPWSGTFSAVSLGSGDSRCALTTSGEADCVGTGMECADSQCQEIVEWTLQDEPAGPFLEVVVGWNHACGLKSDDSVVCWGSNAQGQLDRTCGDGVLDPGEQCDDGGMLQEDGCSAICRLESGWACEGAPSVCTRVCGNGLIDEAEQCDDGNLNWDDGCTPDCYVEEGWECDAMSEPTDCVFVGSPDTNPEVCGDGYVDEEQGEVCDDGPFSGNILSGCWWDCTENVCGAGLPPTPTGSGAYHVCAGAGLVHDIAITSGPLVSVVGVSYSTALGNSPVMAVPEGEAPILYLAQDEDDGGDLYTITELGSIGEPYEYARFNLSVADDGDHFVSGGIQLGDDLLCPGCGDGGFYAARITPTGEPVWTVRHDIFAGRATVSGAGELQLLGPGSELNEMAMARLDADGAVLWSKPLGPGYPINIFRDGEGAWVLSGDADGPDMTYLPLDPPVGYLPGKLSRVDASGGITQTIQLSGTPSQMAVDGDGTIVVVGGSYGPFGTSTMGAYVERFDASGVSLWVEHMPPAGMLGFAMDVAVAPGAFVELHARGEPEAPSSLVVRDITTGAVTDEHFMEHTAVGRIASQAGAVFFTTWQRWGTFYAKYPLTLLQEQP